MFGIESVNYIVIDDYGELLIKRHFKNYSYVNFIILIKNYTILRHSVIYTAIDIQLAFSSNDYIIIITCITVVVMTEYLYG